MKASGQPHASSVFSFPPGEKSLGTYTVGGLGHSGGEKKDRCHCQESNTGSPWYSQPLHSPNYCDSVYVSKQSDWRTSQVLTDVCYVTHLSVVCWANSDFDLSVTGCGNKWIRTVRSYSLYFTDPRPCVLEMFWDGRTTAMKQQKFKKYYL
jgi:hypothetical protein